MAPARGDIDAALAARLVSEQFPHWAHLPVRPVEHSGWDNRSFRLGEAMLVRLPSAAAYADQVAKEQAWLPRLAAQLPLPIPEPVGLGRPGDAFPWPWSIYGWIEGDPAATSPPADATAFAADLGRFLSALYAADADGGPPPGPHNFHRGAPLDVYDAQSREALATLAGRIDTDRATAFWDRALASRWTPAPVWTHGDVAPGNLLVRDGVLSAVIDFGCACVGDPACDLAIAWTTFRGGSRAAFREALPLDEETWARGRGWALWKALIIASGVSRSFEPWITQSWETLSEILAEDD